MKHFSKNEVLLKLSPSCTNKDDGYSSTFLAVVSDARVAIPLHYKRFSVEMFTFIRDKEVLKDQVRTTADAPSVQACCMSAFETVQIYIHCDAVVCDANQMEGSCPRQCAYPRDATSYTPSWVKGGRKGECY